MSAPGTARFTSDPAREFRMRFGYDPEAQAAAPGRVNVLGEHTDYNDGFVLPTPIAALTRVALALARDGQHHVSSAQLGAASDFPPDSDPPTGFARYVWACLRVLGDEGVVLPPLALCIDSEVPIGAGLSSSAALEVAVLRALRARFDLSLDDVRLAQLAQQAEVRHAGVACGIMDQMASSVGRPGQLLFLDTRSLEYRLVPLPRAAALLVLDSGEARELANSGYNLRRSECAAAAQALGVASLREVTEAARAADLPAPLERRARHVITENARVLAALVSDDPGEFGRLMNASHASLRDDYEVSTPALDLLVGLLQAQPGVYGARLTGAGFGGACVALVEPTARTAVSSRVLESYFAAGHRGRRLV